MSLLPPPPAPQQQRRPVRGTTSAAATSRGLYSDAVGLRTGLSAEALRHPTASVGLHDGPTFAPQHRAVAQHAPLDIGAMVAARLSLPEPEMDTAGDKKFMFNYGKKKKGEAAGPAGPGALQKKASSMLDKAKSDLGGALQGAKASMKDQWDAANKEDAITGMDKYDYTFIASKPSLMASERVSMESKSMGKAALAKVGIGTTKKEDVEVLFGGEAVRAAQFEAMLKTDDNNGAIALLATIDKTWDAKEQAFQIQSVQDKIKTFDDRTTYKIPAGAGANSNLVESLRNYWLTTEHAQGIVDAKTVDDYPKRVAALQDEAKKHIRRYDSDKLNDTKDDKWVSGSPHPLSMGQAAMVDVTNDEASLPAHIEAFVGKQFLNYITSTYMQAGRNKRAGQPVEVNEPDSNTPFIIPVGSMYDTGSKAYATLSAAGLAPAGDLHCVNALLVVQVPPDSDARLKQAFGLTDSDDLEVEWSRIAPYQVNPGFKGEDEKVAFTDPFQETHLTVVEGAESAEIDKLVAEAARRKDENTVMNTKLTPEEKTRLAALNKAATDEFYKKEDNMAKATWKETVSGFEKKNNIAIYGLHLDYQCFQDPSKSKEGCAPKKIMISKHPLFIRPFGGSGVADFEAPSPKDLMRIWTIGEGNKLLNALPLALKGQGFDCRFLWAALKLAQRSFRTAEGKAKPGVKQVLNIKGGKVTTATRAKHRWLNGLKAKKSQKPGTLASFEGDYDDVFVGCCFSDDEEE